MGEDDDLICAYLLDRKGGGPETDWPEVHGWRPEAGPVWTIE
jgi:hypothetical protein